jgi:2-dehydro-3-deoxyphosphogalactonate aldolase
VNVVAILRGVTPDSVVEVATCLLQCGIGTIEVPLNSPDALQSLRLLRERLPAQALIGAGTVLSVQQVEAVAQAGAALVVSPDLNADVVRRTKSLGLTSMPGVATPTEAFRALDAGADLLKLFPAEVLGPATLKAWRSVLPREVRLYAVGGIEAGNAATFMAAGATGVGVGGWLYRPGRGIDEIRHSARQLLQALGAAGSAA